MLWSSEICYIALWSLLWSSERCYIALYIALWSSEMLRSADRCRIETGNSVMESVWDGAELGSQLKMFHISHWKKKEKGAHSCRSDGMFWRGNGHGHLDQWSTSFLSPLFIPNIFVLTQSLACSNMPTTESPLLLVTASTFNFHAEYFYEGLPDARMYWVWTNIKELRSGLAFMPVPEVWRVMRPLLLSTVEKYLPHHDRFIAL